MNEQLHAKIDGYQESLQSLREEGQSLRDRLTSEGWQPIEKFLDLGYSYCLIHPDSLSLLQSNRDLSHDEEDDVHFLNRELSADEWEQIVELPLF